MSVKLPTAVVDPMDVADILANIAELMAEFRDSDIALQNAISTLTRNPGEAPNMSALQHVDLLTQSHDDLSKLLLALGPCLRGAVVQRDDLKQALRLRSLQDALVTTDKSDTAQADKTAGDVSLF